MFTLAMTSNLTKSKFCMCTMLSSLVLENYLSYHIEMDPNAKPVQENPRLIPIPVKDDLKKKIEELETMGVIAKVSKPTPWISNMVVVRRPNKLKLCLDPVHLKGVIRNHYPTPTIEDIAPKLTKANVFAVVDAEDGK